MLDRNLIGKVGIVVGVFILFSVFLAFGVLGNDDLIRQESLRNDNVDAGGVLGEIETGDSDTYFGIDEGQLENFAVYVKIDESLDKESNQMRGEEFYSENFAAAVEDKEPMDNLVERDELVKSLTAFVEVGGELKNKEIMKIIYSSDQEEVVKEIERKEVVVESGGQVKKEIVVSSNEHFDGEIFYKSYFSSEVKSKEMIKLYWKNEEREVDFQTGDENGNGLIDYIAWTIPHLSVQEFEITIYLSLVNETNLTNEVVINVDYAPSSVVSSLVDFRFNVSYYDVGLLACWLNLANVDEGVLVSRNVSGNGIFRLNLSNGQYLWNFSCFDTINDSIGDFVNGSFIVNASYFLSVSLSASPETILQGNIVNFVFNVSAPPNSCLLYTSPSPRDS